MAADRFIHQRGHSFTELLLVVAILALAAGLAGPVMAPGEPAQLDLAATRVANAIRYARDTARISGQTHGVLIDPANQAVTVFRADMLAVPVAPAEVSRHPISKQDYVVRMTGAANIQPTSEFTYQALPAIGEVLFTAEGVPHHYSSALDSYHRLTGGAVVLALGNASRQVSIDPYTGRVGVE